MIIQKLINNNWNIICSMLFLMLATENADTKLLYCPH